MAQVRAIADAFPDEPHPQALTPMEVRLARHTPVEALESAAEFLDAMPHLAQGMDAELLREAIAFELAYDGVRVEALALVRRVEHAILRRKLKAVKITRGLYRIAKGYATLEQSTEAVQKHVLSLKRSLVRPRGRKRAKGEGKTDGG
ncbi:MAG TPA: hypothetical protein VNA69_08395 [Thermoanaerobaculia bacterium]|nr:hypothetical protein [Thermoanaerobaculia bacterium]